MLCGTKMITISFQILLFYLILLIIDRMTHHPSKVSLYEILFHIPFTTITITTEVGIVIKNSTKFKIMLQ